MLVLSWPIFVVEVMYRIFRLTSTVMVFILVCSMLELGCVAAIEVRESVYLLYYLLSIIYNIYIIAPKPSNGTATPTPFY